jgi:hypothetical protein
MGRQHELRKEDFKARYFVLFVVNLAQVASSFCLIKFEITFFYCFDMPSALKDQITLAFSKKYS